MIAMDPNLSFNKSSRLGGALRASVAFLGRNTCRTTYLGSGEFRGMDGHLVAVPRCNFSRRRWENPEGWRGKYRLMRSIGGGVVGVGGGGGV